VQTLLGKHWHHLPATEALQLLESNLQTGPDIFEVQHRQHRFGPNVLTPKRGKSPLTRFLLQFKNPLILILLASSVITALILTRELTGRVLLGVSLLGYLIVELEKWIRRRKT
jgi:Ca2+-transporting ATPase